MREGCGKVLIKGANRASVGNWNETNGLNANFWNSDNVNPNLRLAPVIVSCSKHFENVSILQAFYLFLGVLLGGGYNLFPLGIDYLWRAVGVF